MKAYSIVISAVIASLLLCSCCALGETVDISAPVPANVDNASFVPSDTATVKTDDVRVTNASYLSYIPPEPPNHLPTSISTTSTTTAPKSTTATTSLPTTTAKPTDPPKPTELPTPVPPKPTELPTPVPPEPTLAPTPVPHQPECKFHTLSFIGGTIFAWGLVGIGFVAHKAYQARTEHNYHTL